VALLIVAKCTSGNFQVLRGWQPCGGSATQSPNLHTVGCETWSLTLTEERRLRVFESRALKRIFGPKRDEVTGEWRKLYNEELNDFYSSPNIVRVIKSIRMRWAEHVACMGESRVLYRVLVGKHEGKRPLVRP